MGNLFTRALRRLTQCSDRNQVPSREQQDAGTSQQQQAEQQSRPIVQSIPVGQSIDSADYAAFESAKSSQSGLETRASEQESRRSTVNTTIEEEEEGEGDDNEGATIGKENEQLYELTDEQRGEQNKPEVEEAVIKIQAFVRGHLTRKALKDAQQQAATLPPNALGQSHFDHESLMKSSPSAVFAMSAPTDLLNDQLSRLATSAGSSRVAPLESIAEDVELSGQPASEHAQQSPRRKLAPINRSLAISSEIGRSESVSPVPSEANASIELRCDTPASASIDILDHNIRPADALASVLHPKGASEAPGAGVQEGRSADSWPRMVVEAPPPRPMLQHAHNGIQSNSQAPQETLHQSSTIPGVQNSHSIDSAEAAAAIRIQSAYRGYHTRKHSPYRRRSPAGGLAFSSPPPAQLSLDSGLSNGQAARRSPLRQQNASVALDDLIDEELDEADVAINADEQQRLERLQEAPMRRASRQRHRLDTDDSQRSDSLVTQGAALEGATSTTIDEPSNDTCISTVALDSTDAPADNLSHQAAAAANLTRADHSSASTPARPLNEHVKMSIEQNLSLDVDTESSNLGAALSMNEDISEREAISSIGQQGSSPDERASEVQRFVDQLVNDEDEDEDDEANGQKEEAEEELQRDTGPLEAALEPQATEEDGGEQMAESLANAILDEEELRTNELESDDIERRDPRGQRSQDRPNSPAIATQDTQPALVSGGSFDDEQQQELPQQQRLGVESPDEAIGSGRSSPALVSSNAGSSEEDDYENENEEEAETKTGVGQAADKQGQPQQGGQSGNKNRKKNRNRKKGRK